MQLMRHSMKAVLIAAFSVQSVMAAEVASPIIAITNDESHVLISTANPLQGTACAYPGWSLDLHNAQDNALYNLLVAAWLRKAPVRIEGAAQCDDVTGAEKIKSVQWDALEAGETKTYSNLTEAIKKCAYDSFVSDSRVHFTDKVPALNVPGDFRFWITLMPLVPFDIAIAYPTPTDVKLTIIKSPVSADTVWDQVDQGLNACKKNS